MAEKKTNLLFSWSKAPFSNIIGRDENFKQTKMSKFFSYGSLLYFPVATIALAIASISVAIPGIYAWLLVGAVTSLCYGVPNLMDSLKNKKPTPIMRSLSLIFTAPINTLLLPLKIIPFIINSRREKRKDRFNLAENRLNYLDDEENIKNKAEEYDKALESKNEALKSLKQNKILLKKAQQLKNDTGVVNYIEEKKADIAEDINKINESEDALEKNNIGAYKFYAESHRKIEENNKDIKTNQDLLAKAKKLNQDNSTKAYIDSVKEKLKAQMAENDKLRKFINSKNNKMKEFEKKQLKM